MQALTSARPARASGMPRAMPQSRLKGVKRARQPMNEPSDGPRCRRRRSARRCAAPRPAAHAREQIKAIVASPDRSAADRTNDLRRKPEQMLDFIGIRPASPRSISAPPAATRPSCWRARSDPRARSMARAGRAPAGRRRRRPPRPRATAIRPPRPPPRQRPLRRPAARRVPRRWRWPTATRPCEAAKAAPIVAVVRPFEDPVPAEAADGQLDLVTLMFNYHDLGFLGVDRAAMNRAVFKALKPGGVYVIADHAGRPGTGISEVRHLHRDRGGVPAQGGRGGGLQAGGRRQLPAQSQRSAGTRTRPTRRSPRTSSC